MATVVTKLDVLKTYYNEYLVICEKYLGNKMIFEKEDKIDFVYLYDLIKTYFKMNETKHNRIELKKLLLYKKIIFTHSKLFDEFYEETEVFIHKTLSLENSRFECKCSAPISVVTVETKSPSIHDNN